MTDALNDIPLAEIRRTLARMVAMADSAERPKPDVINPPGHSMPGHEWRVAQHVYADHVRQPLWIVRTVDDPENCDGVHVGQPDPYNPCDPDFTGMLPVDARRLAMALLAAADRAEHLTAGVPRLQDRRATRSATT